MWSQLDQLSTTSSWISHLEQLISKAEMTLVRRESRKKSVYFYNGHSCPFPQLLSPRTVSQALAPAHQALGLHIAQVFGTAWHFVTVHIWDMQLDSEVSSGLSHGQSVRTVSVDSAWRDYSTCFLGRGSRSTNTCSPRREKESAPLQTKRVIKWCFLSRGEQWMTECD